MAGRNEIILKEAEAWRAEGRIDDAFHKWVQERYPAPSDAGTARLLQTVLLFVASVLTIVGLITLVSQFWSEFTRSAKFWTLCGFAAIAVLLGVWAHAHPRTRLLSHFLLPLALPLYLFAMTYGGDRPYAAVGDGLSIREGLVVAVGCVAALAALTIGIHRFPTLALGGPPSLVAAIFAMSQFVALTRTEQRGLQWASLTIVFLLHALLLLLWAGQVRLPQPWLPFSARVALAGNVPAGFILIVSLVDEYAYAPVAGPADTMSRVYDPTYVGVPLTAFYLAILMGFGLRWGLPELTGVAGLFLIGDAIWLGADEGGVLGAVLAIFVAAGILVFLAQRGVLLRIFKPRPPPTTGRGSAAKT